MYVIKKQNSAGSYESAEFVVDTYLVSINRKGIYFSLVSLVILALPFWTYDFPSSSVPLVIVRSEPLIVIFSVFLQLILSTIVASENREKVSNFVEKILKKYKFLLSAQKA